MCSTVSLMSIVAVLVMDVRIGALQQELKGVECNQCTLANSTAMCEQRSEWAAAACPADAPYCATIAHAPNFRSNLACSADSNTPCSLSALGNTIQLTCVCKEHLCNTPLSQKLRTELLNFSTKANTSANLTEIFYKIAISANSTEQTLYKEITVDVTEVIETTLNNTSELTTLPPASSIKTSPPPITTHAELPRAEALKQETTAPSDDDEDEGEGSGAYEDPRSQHAASAPAAPSSFLPANESKASNLLTNLVLITSLAACSSV